MNIMEPDAMAADFRALIRHEILTTKLHLRCGDTPHPQIRIVGFLASGDQASQAYANYTRIGCEDVGMHFELHHATTDNIVDLIARANDNPMVHGIFVYYPIFGDDRDKELRNLIAWQKDVEGLTSHWMTKLYANERFADAYQKHKAILPCTPLAIIKILATTDVHKAGPSPLAGTIVTVFNRSEVVGRPLAYMLANDGALVYSFDVNGGVIVQPDVSSYAAITRENALKASDVVITGVPTPSFPKIAANELKVGAIGLNFSFIANFTDAAKQQVRCYIPRVGVMTVAMCLRNALRLYHNYHHDNMTVS